MNQLKNCRVIEGFLQILLIDNPTMESFDNYTFPLLTEITDFFLIFRIRGLRSIGRLFPNLSIVRGNILFQNYAMVIFEVFNLEEVGLTSLKYIGRGGVRIEKNNALCYSQSVDWSHITNGSVTETHYFAKNRKDNECPVCPGANSSDARLPCPPLPLTKGKRYSCWNLDRCQTICPSKCRWNCDDNGNCCDEQCLGGCSNNNATACTACKHFEFGKHVPPVCVEKCPDGYLSVS